MELRSHAKLDSLSKEIALHLLWLLPCLLILIFVFINTFSGLVRADAMDAAQVGRQIAEGRGFSTGFIRPLSLAYRPYAEPYPDLYQAPLYPFFLGLAFTLLPDTDKTVAVCSATLFFLTCLLVFFWAKRYLNPWVAGLSALLLSLNFALLEIAVSGSGLMLWLFLVVLASFLLYLHPGTARYSFLAGAVCALSILADYLAVALLPVYLWLLLSSIKERKRAHLLFFALGLIIPLAPWAIRNFRLVGSPFFTLRTFAVAMYGGVYPGHTLLRDISFPEGGAWGYLLAHPTDILRKMLIALKEIYAGLPLLCGLYVVPFFIVGSLHASCNPRLARLRAALFYMLALLYIAIGITRGAAELFLPLVPLVVIFAVAYFEDLLAARNWKTKKAFFARVLLVLIAGLPLFLNLLFYVPPASVSRGNLRYLAQMVPQDALVASDIPWAVAWYAARPCAWLPSASLSDPEMGPDPTRTGGFAALDGETGRVQAIFLSTELLSYSPEERLLGWQRLSESPEDFEVAAVLPPRELLLVRKSMLDK